MANQEKIFPDGLRFEEPPQGAPNFVKGKISINIDKFIDFLKIHANERGWVNLDVKESKEGKIYVELNTYKATVKVQGEIPVIEENYPAPAKEDIDPKDIPF